MIKIAKYLRLSLEDECLQDESTSILSQRLIIDSFIREHEEFNDALTEEYIDDGYSGTNMKRPAMESLLSKIKTGEVDVIIVKDLSRFSRDYIELGKYLEKIFPFLGIRFIAINDNYDSKDTDGGIGSIDSNFKTLINDYYSKDTSEKILSNYRAQTKKGKAILWAPSYGYMKDPKDKHQFLVDEVAAKTVKKIFDWSLKGWSIHKITRQLSQDGDITPAERKKMLTNMDYKHKQKTGKDKTYRWNVSTVSRITRDKEYTGYLIKGVSTRKEVGSEERVAVNPKDWIVVPNHHEPIISEEVFNEVQSLKAKRPKYFKKGQAIDSPIKSLVICKHCGHKIRFLKRTDDIE
ncbi:MAG: recombinase family protein, partial [Tissierellia bacterium]|nr:recombinase family protein [Tissierellia bacterium]